MRRHIPRERSEPQTTLTNDRRGIDRAELSQFATTRYVVVLGAGNVLRAELLNESNSGIGIRAADIESSTKAGEFIEVIHRGKRKRAKIRYVTESTEGFLIGLEWKPVYG
jgi:hypothetical protein